jgi:peroxiredoxin
VRLSGALGLLLWAQAGCAHGASADDLALPDLRGGTWALAEQRGRVVLVSFFATWCVPCAAELREAERLWQKYRDRGLVVIAVSTDGPSSEGNVPAFVERHGLSFPVLLDRESRAFERYQPKGVMPFWVLFDRQGRKRRTHEGYSPGAEAEIERAVVQLL